MYTMKGRKIMTVREALHRAAVSARCAQDTGDRAKMNACKRFIRQNFAHRHNKELTFVF